MLAAYSYQRWRILLESGGNSCSTNIVSVNALYIYQNNNNLKYPTAFMSILNKFFCPCKCISRTNNAHIIYRKFEKQIQYKHGHDNYLMISVFSYSKLKWGELPPPHSQVRGSCPPAPLIFPHYCLQPARRNSLAQYCCMRCIKACQEHSYYVNLSDSLPNYRAFPSQLRQ